MGDTMRIRRWSTLCAGLLALVLAVTSCEDDDDFYVSIFFG